MLVNEYSIFCLKTLKLTYISVQLAYLKLKHIAGLFNTWVKGLFRGKKGIGLKKTGKNWMRVPNWGKKAD